MVSLNNKGFTITGTKDVVRVLESIDRKHARNLLRATVHGVASHVGKLSKANARQHKDTGLLLKSIKWKRKKSPPEKPVSIVFVKKEAFYWRFVEHGTNGSPTRNIPALPERPIFRKAERDIRPRLPAIYAAEFSKKLEAKIKREMKKR